METQPVLLPLLLHHVLQLGTLDLQLPLPLVLQDVSVRLPVQLTLQPLPVLLIPLAAALVPRPFDPQARQVALHIAIGATAPRSRQANPIVHGSAKINQGCDECLNRPQDLGTTTPQYYKPKADIKSKDIL